MKPADFTNKPTPADTDRLPFVQDPFTPGSERYVRFDQHWDNYVRPKLPILNLADYNPPANGIDDDVAAIETAFADLPIEGGQLFIPSDLELLIDTDLVIPDNVELVGERGVFGNITPAEMNAYGPKLYVNSSAKIKLGNSSTLTRLAIYRKGLVFSNPNASPPVSVSSSDVTAEFLGTAVEIMDATTEATVQECCIFGFNRGVASVDGATNVSRVRLRRLNIDCKNGVRLLNSYDICYLEEIHCWPFVTVNSEAESEDAHLKRSGAAIFLSGTNDWTKVSRCFSYGYFRGIQTHDGHNIIIDNCGADHVPAAVDDGSIGFLCGGTCGEVLLIGCQTAAKQHGFYFNSSDSKNKFTMIGCEAWEFDGNGVVVDRGHVEAIGCIFRKTGAAGSTNGYLVLNNTSDVSLNVIGGKIDGTANGINNAAATNKVRHTGVDFFSVTTPATNAYVPSLASAATITPNAIETTFNVTGTTGISAIGNAAAYAGKTLCLIFAGALTITHGTNLQLAGNTNYTTAAGDVLIFRSDGTIWYEVGRNNASTMQSVIDDFFPNPISDGAAGDGVSDDKPELDIKMPAVFTQGEILNGLGKTYKIGSLTGGGAGLAPALTAGKVARLRDCILDVSGLGSASNYGGFNDIVGLFLFGADMNDGGYANTTLSVAASRGDESVTVTSAAAISVAKGDLLFFHEDVAWGDEASGARKTDAHKVKSVSGNVIELEAGLLCAFTTSATVRKYPNYEVILQDVELIGGGAGDGQNGIAVVGVSRLYAENVTVRECEERALVIANSFYAEVDGYRALAADKAGLGYGVVTSGVHSCVVGYAYMENARHGFASGYGPTTLKPLCRFLGIDDIRGYGMTDAIVDAHPGVFSLEVRRAEATFQTDAGTSGDGFLVQCPRAVLGSIYLYGPKRHGLLIQPYGHGDGSGVESYYTCESLTAELNASSGQYPFAFDDTTATSDVLFSQLAINHLNVKGRYGGLVKTANNDLKKTALGNGSIKVTSTNAHGVHLLSTSGGAPAEVDIGPLHIEIAGTTGLYPVYAQGVGSPGIIDRVVLHAPKLIGGQYGVRANYAAIYDYGAVYQGQTAGNYVLDTGGTYNTFATSANAMLQGLVTLPVLAAAMTPATTNGAASATLESTTNKVTYKVLDFDQTTEEFAHFAVPFPKSWNRSTITFEVLWTASAGSGGVVWALEAIALSDDDAIDTAYGTAVQVSDTLIATGDVHKTAVSSALTVGGSPAVGDLVFFRIKRVPADGSDTLTGDARLIGIRLFFTQNAADDT